MKKALSIMLFLSLVLSFCALSVSAAAEESLTSKSLASFGVKLEKGEPVGVLITRVSSDGLGAQAGLKVNDVIVGVGGENVLIASNFASIWKSYSAGNIITFDLLRRGNKFSVNITKSDSQEVGITIDDNGAVGARVTDLRSESAAAKAGIRVGDILAGFNQESIQSMSDLSRALENCQAGQSVEVEFYHDGVKNFEKVILDTSTFQITESESRSKEVSAGDALSLFSVCVFCNDSAVIPSFTWYRAADGIDDLWIEVSPIGKKDGLCIERSVDLDNNSYTVTLRADDVKEKASGKYFCSVKLPEGMSYKTDVFSLTVH